MPKCTHPSGHTSPPPQPQRIHLVFKTHLDIGFTGFAARILEQYMSHHVPNAIRTARRLRENGSTDRFVWTTGSWLIHEILESGSISLKRNLEQAIADGDIAWHGLPFTTHSELMDAGLFRYGLGLSKELDRRFGKQTIAAKMTDVPGHTRAIVPLLAEAGIRFLHVGVNAASCPPDVPACFVWRHDDNSEVMVAYGHGGYGGTFRIDGVPDGLVFGHTGDNRGPQGIKEVSAQFQKIRRESPDAEVLGSTLDTFAQALIDASPKLPVITDEIGDTWIHGVGTDPGKVRCFLERCRNGRYDKNLLLVAEHTWGLDTKKTIRVGENEEFMPEPFSSNGEFRKRRRHGRYRRWEESWREQRTYIGVERTVLPDPPSGGRIIKSLPAWVEKTHPVLLYEVFGSRDYDRFIERYNPNLDSTRGWAIPDFTKPGLENHLENGRKWHAAPGPIRSFGRRVVAEYGFPKGLSRNYGCPRKFHLTIEGNDLVVEWREKPASRLPEAIWIGFFPVLQNPKTLRMIKLGQAVSPFGVVRNGARNLHAVSKVVSNDVSLLTLDAPLFSPGPPSLLSFPQREPEPQNGIYFCLYNNVWGTNFPMWYDEDASFRFRWTFLKDHDGK